MRVLEIEISGFRGIHRLTLHPNGKNFLILGPNGTGKSAVVDAIDYLVSGRISRLTGPGTDNLKLELHGPHLDYRPQDACVSGTVKLEDVDQPVKIVRNLASRTPKVEPKSAEWGLERIVGLARQGQHLLTRKQILRFIVAEAGNRAEMVQAVLDASEVEKARKAIFRSKGNLEREAKIGLSNSTDAKTRVSRLLGADLTGEADILAAINRLREILGWAPLTSIWLPLLAVGSSDRPAPLPASAGAAQALSELRRLAGTVGGPGSREGRDSYRALCDLLRSVRSKPDLITSIATRQLVETGLSLLDGTGACPLCGLPWEEGQLRRHLDARLERAREAETTLQSIANAAERVRLALGPVSQIIGGALSYLGGGESAEPATQLRAWKVRLDELLGDLQSPLDKIHTEAYRDEQLGVFLSSDRERDMLGRAISIIAPSVASLTPQQLALTTLAKVEEALKRVGETDAKRQDASRAEQHAVVLYEEFERAQTDVFSGIYSEVAARFSQLYSTLHASEEPTFRARLTREGAGLDFQVDFAGRGFFPPQALHSEGHQDSMGLCLFLALSERISSGSVGFALLDDVAMSIDHEHRRALARLLAACSKERQFIITTHDRVWAEQLRIHGVVADENTFEIRNWSLEGGPVGGPRDPPWSRIGRRLDENDVKGAASLLREYLEFFFSEVCASLRARVTYHADARWEMQELLQEGAARYLRLLRKGADLANARSVPAMRDALRDAATAFETLLSTSRDEGWVINPTVHYTPWADLSPADFRPTVDTFERVCDDFRCRDCGSLLAVVLRGAREVTVRCNCGKRQWDVSELGATVPS